MGNEEPPFSGFSGPAEKLFITHAEKPTPQPAKTKLASDKVTFGKRTDGIEVLPVTVDGLPAEWIIPAGATKDKVILYTIGGAYVSGSCQDHRRIVFRIAKGSEVSTLLFEHRLSPEHPFPAALDDSVTAYRWLLAKGISPSNIMIVGESAGGG